MCYSHKVVKPPNLKFKVTVSKQQEISIERNEVNDKKCDSEILKGKRVD